MGALSAWGAILGLGFLLAVLLRLGFGGEWEEADVPMAGLAGILAMLVIRLPVTLMGTLDWESFQLSGSATAVTSLGALFAVGMAAIFIAGRAAARSAVPADPRTVVIQGAKTGIAFAAIAFVATFVLQINRPATPLDPPLVASADKVGSVWWALAYGIVFGLLGAFSALRRSSTPPISSTLPETLQGWGHATAGAVRAVAYGLLLTATAFTLFVAIIAAVDSRQPGSSFDGIGEILGLVAVVLLVLPDAAVAGLLTGHGATLNLTWFVDGSFDGPFSYHLLNFPTDDRTIGDAELAPWYVFALLIIPLLAVVSGAYRTTRSTGAETREQARRAGMRAAVPYALLLGLLAAFTRLQVHGPLTVFGNDPHQVSQIDIRYSLVGVLALGLAWGVVGAVFASLRYPRSPRAEQPTSQPRAPQRLDLPANTADEVICPNCGDPNLPDNAFCNNCGQPLTPTQRTQPAVTPPQGAPATTPPPQQHVCSNCGHPNRPANRFCSKCGQPLTPDVG